MTHRQARGKGVETVPGTLFMLAAVWMSSAAYANYVQNPLSDRMRAHTDRINRVVVFIVQMRATDELTLVVGGMQAVPHHMWSRYMTPLQPLAHAPWQSASLSSCSHPCRMSSGAG